MVEIPLEAIDKFIKWNQQPFDTKEIFDQKMVFALLFICADDDKIIANMLHDDVKQFLRGTKKNNFYLYCQRKMVFNFPINFVFFFQRYYQFELVATISVSIKLMNTLSNIANMFKIKSKINAFE